MGLYYSTDFVLRWYKADDSLLEQDHGRTQYTVIDTDKLVALREQDTSSTSIRTWLGTNGVPPDGYHPPYDGTMPEELLSRMEAGITNARAVSRAYAVLDDDSVMESGTFLALSELRKLFLPQETREQHTQRILDIESRMPRFFAEKYKYTDECLRMLMGHAPLQSNYLATGYLLSCIWADIEEEIPDELVKKLEYTSREYKSENRKRKGDTISVNIPWYVNPAAKKYIAKQFTSLTEGIINSLKYYRRKGLDGAPGIDTYPGAWKTAISKYESLTEGPRWNTAEDVLSDITRNPNKYIRFAVDDYANIKLRDLTYNYDSEKKKRQLVSPTINTLLYAAIVNEQVSHVQYRKCLLCDNYFQLSNHKTRIYCDVHMGPSAKYYRKRMEELRKKQQKATDESCPKESE